MKIPQMILDGWADLQRLRETFVPLRDRLRRTTEDANREFARDYLTNKVFVTHDEVHQRRVQRDVEARIRQQREAAVGVGLLAVERALHTIEPEVRAFKQAAMVAPDPVDAWMIQSGGDRKF